MSLSIRLHYSHERSNALWLPPNSLFRRKVYYSSGRECRVPRMRSQTSGIMSPALRNNTLCDKKASLAAATQHSRQDTICSQGDPMARAAPAHYLDEGFEWASRRPNPKCIPPYMSMAHQTNYISLYIYIHTTYRNVHTRTEETNVIDTLRTGHKARRLSRSVWN